MKNLFILLVFVALVSSCYYDNGEELYPVLNTDCDTTNVSFNPVISSILQNNCLSCHSNATAASSGNNIKLENYADVVSSADAVLGSIRHDTPYSPMPKNGGKLNACIISQLEKWITNGTPQN
jgi:hypothetical protein